MAKKILEKYLTHLEDDSLPKVNWELLVSDRKDAETGQKNHGNLT